MRLVATTAVAFVVLGASSASATSFSPDNTTSWNSGLATAFLNPQGIATGPDGDVVYVADTGRNRIVEYTSNGLLVRAWGRKGTKRGQLSQPASVATDPDGNVYVADTGNARVQKFSAEGKYLARFDAPFVRGVATDKDHLFILSGFFQLVAKKTFAGADAGAWRAVFPGKYFPYAGYGDATNDVTAIAADRKGRAYVAGHSSQPLDSPEPDCHNVIDANSSLDHRPYVDPLTSGKVARFGTTGGLDAQGWLNYSPIDCYHGWFSHGDPTGVAVDPADGAVYVSQREHYIHQLGPNLEAPWAYGGQEHGGEGRLQFPCPTCANALEPNFGTPSGLAFDCRSNLYVMTPDRVLKYRNPRNIRGTCPPRFAELFLSSTVEQAGTKFIQTTLDCEGRQLCRGTIELTGRRKGCEGRLCAATLGAKEFSIAAGRARTLSLKLKGAARKLVALDDPLAVRAVAHVRTGGKRRVRSARMTLRDPSKLSLDCGTEATAGIPFSVSGKLSPVKATTAAARVAPVELLYTSPLGTTVRQRVSAGPGGRIAAGFTPDLAGAWIVTAVWPGDHTYDLARARGCNLDVKPPPSSLARQSAALTLTCPPPTDPYQPAPFSGGLTPALPDRTVEIDYTSPSGSKVTHLVYTDASGRYTDALVPPGDATTDAEGRPTYEGGTWTAQARWGGDAGHEPAVSAACQFVLKTPA